MRQAYESKNQSDFEENTRQINAAIHQIETNDNLKATISEIVAITGLHRNTISLRGWASGKLKAIKKKREQRAAELKETKVAEKVDYKDQLNLALDELCFWHNSALVKDEEIKSLNRQLSLQQESKVFWEKEAKKSREVCKELEGRVNKLQDLLEAL